MMLRLTLGLSALLLALPILRAQAPDLVVTDLVAPTNYNAIGGFDAVSLGMLTCNQGNAPADWVGTTAAHPVLTQNLYRLAGNRFEQIGQSWARHLTLAVPTGGCASTGNPGLPGASLQNGFGDQLSGGLMAVQSQLGPRGEIDPVTGQFPFPPTDIALTGDDTFKRLRVATSDLDATLHPGARFFAEGMVVAADDATSGNRSNNRSWREMSVQGGPNNFNFGLAAGSTRPGEAALQAWREIDPSVQLFAIDVPQDGRILVAFRGEPTPSGGFAYEFAVANLDSARGVRSFRVFTPNGAQLSDIGFHDVDNHSGSPFDSTDWTVTTAPGEIAWATDDFATNPNANALRWGTLYNYRFESDVQPVQTSIDIELELFAPGASPNLIEVTLPPITFLTVIGGDDQAGNIGDAFLQELAVEAQDNFGNPVSGVSIDFAPVSGTPVTFPNGTSALTDSQGIARITVAGGTAGGAAVVEASSFVASQPVTFNLFVRRFTRQFFPSGVAIFTLQTDLPSQPMTIAVDDPGVPMVTTPFGVLCTSILAPGPAFFAQSGFVTPEAGFDPTLVTTSTGNLTKVYLGLISLVNSGIVANHQAYSFRVVNGELDVYISNCVTATY